MHYCAICLQPPERCTCVWARGVASEPPAFASTPELPPLLDGEQLPLLPVDWPDRRDLA